MTRALHLDPARILDISNGFGAQRIVVLGDLMLDRFIWGAVRRISPEAPVPVVEVDRESQHLGGAGNVVANVVALGAHARPVGVTGDDANADLLDAEFRLAGVDTTTVVRDATRPTTTKTRIIAHSQQVVRADRERRHPVSADIADALLEAFAVALDDASAVVVSDYDKGLLGGDVLARALAMARQRGVVVCLDPKVRRFHEYTPVSVITPNHHEAESASGLPAGTDDEIEACGQRLQQMLGGPAVLITRGESGMTLVDDDGSAVHVPTMAREVYDVTGAGDTVIATLALALAAGATMREAAVLSNIAAGVVVGKVGTATLSVDELIAAADAAHTRD
ncbi:MAG: D-glycero-beta-D-manno-heptose-7-phosphate kinase [Blastocatellia bacterium]|nr:D-glycero-beta-D-manno-heptose-7-phosphate kinase [Blastocatellia bacterium]